MSSCHYHTIEASTMPSAQWALGCVELLKVVVASEYYDIICKHSKRCSWGSGSQARPAGGSTQTVMVMSAMPLEAGS